MTETAHTKASILHPQASIAVNPSTTSSIQTSLFSTIASTLSPAISSLQPSVRVESTTPGRSATQASTNPTTSWSTTLGSLLSSTAFSTQTTISPGLPQQSTEATPSTTTQTVGLSCSLLHPELCGISSTLLPLSSPSTTDPLYSTTTSPLSASTSTSVAPTTSTSIITSVSTYSTMTAAKTTAASPTTTFIPSSTQTNSDSNGAYVTPSHGGFKPDRLSKLDATIIVIYLCIVLSTSISVSTMIVSNFFCHFGRSVLVVQFARKVTE